MPMPKVSIVLVNWNNFDDTVECLESLRKVTYPNLETIVVDNGSDGDDAVRLKETFTNDIRLIENEKNVGFAEGCNTGMRDALARGTDYVVLLNNDTWVSPDFLNPLVDLAETDEGIGIAGGMVYCYELPDTIWFGGGFLNFWSARTPIRGGGDIDRGQFDDVTEVDWICGCFMFISKSVLTKVGMLDRSFFFGWEDVDFCVRTRNHGFKIFFVPGSKIWHKGFSSGKRKAHAHKPMYYATRGQFIFMEKHLSRLQRLSAMILFAVSLPKVMWDYSRMLGQWKASISILQGAFSYLKGTFKTNP